MRITLYDTTLRDGTQREGIALSARDKITIAKRLDRLGIKYIEGGWPGSNPKDMEFFRLACHQTFEQAIITAFGSTRRAGVDVTEDANLRALLESETRAVALFGKSSPLQVKHVLRTTLDENLQMITDSCAYMKANGREVIYDAEHFYDGYKLDPEYAIATLRAAIEGGAEIVVLCETNGGFLPNDVRMITEAVAKELEYPLGIHAHNDGGLGVANTLQAVEAGAIHVQGTINGYGERCGNADLCSVVPNLQLKMGHECITPDQLATLTDVSRFVSEVANLNPDAHAPFVGYSAFAHKGGMHVNALLKWSDSYQHIQPELVGNSQRILVSELSGKSNLISKVEEFGLEGKLSADQLSLVIQQIKRLENQGFQFEGAEASVELMLRRAESDYKPPFDLIDFYTLVENRNGVHNAGLSEATVKVRVGGEVMHTAAEGNGPVNALDKALRKALIPFFPQLSQIQLVDYKVRILDTDSATAAKTRVLLESRCGDRGWSTVGSSTNIIEASWIALTDSLEYGLLVCSQENYEGNIAGEEVCEPVDE
jgi:2-isopropylmalate synthase